MKEKFKLYLMTIIVHTDILLNRLIYIKLKLFPIYTGPTTAMYISDYIINGFTKGKLYYVEWQDDVSYYVHDDSGLLQEVVKTMFKDISKERDKKLRKLGI
jgi:hypothetical protein